MGFFGVRMGWGVAKSRRSHHNFPSLRRSFGQWADFVSFMSASKISFWGFERVQWSAGVCIEFVVAVMLSWLTKCSYESVWRSHP